MQGRVFQKLDYRVPFLDTTIIIINGTKEAVPLCIIPMWGLMVLCPAAVLGEEQKCCGDSPR